jgi:hypothetical protein
VLSSWSLWAGRPFESGGDHPAGRPVIRPRRQARISRPWWRPADPRAGVWSAVLAVGMAQPAPDGLPGDARVDELAGMRVTRLLIVVDFADDAFIGVADGWGVRRPRPGVVGGALVGSVMGCSV